MRPRPRRIFLAAQDDVIRCDAPCNPDRPPNRSSIFRTPTSRSFPPQFFDAAEAPLSRPLLALELALPLRSRLLRRRHYASGGPAPWFGRRLGSLRFPLDYTCRASPHG